MKIQNTPLKFISALLITLFIFACSKPDAPTTATANCNCERTFYNYQPPMIGPNGQVLVPGVYNLVSLQTGVCGTTTNGYVVETSPNYNRSKTVCK